MEVAGDRESDIFALFQQHAAQAGGAGLPVRANAGRRRQVQVRGEDFQATIIRAIGAQPDFERPLVTGHEIVIDSQGGRWARKRRAATTEIRIGQVELRPPREQAGAEPLRVWLVRVLETDPPRGQEVLEWLLVSSEGGRRAEWAERIVGWYERRRGIEEYFRVLKSGARIEDRGLRDTAAPGKCPVFDAISAWRGISLERYALDAARAALPAGQEERPDASGPPLPGSLSSHRIASSDSRHAAGNSLLADADHCIPISLSQF